MDFENDILKNVQYLKYDIVEQEREKSYERRLCSLGVEFINLTGINLNFYEEIVLAVEKFTNTFPCMRGFLKDIKLDLNYVTKTGFMYVRFPPSSVTLEEDYSIISSTITRPTLYLSKNYLDSNYILDKYRILEDTGYTKVANTYKVTLHELSHLLELVICIISNNFDIYDISNPIELDRRTFELGAELKQTKVKTLLQNLYGQTIAEIQKNYLNYYEVNSKEYFDKCNEIFPNHCYAFKNDSEFFAEMISTKLYFGKQAGEFENKYYNLFLEEYSDIINIPFSDYRNSKSKGINLL